MTRKVLVTGADGFIGSHLTEELVKQGYKVRALSLYNSFGTRGWLDTVDESVLNEIEIISGDIRDTFQMNEISKGMDSIFHLAALIAIPYSYHAPQSYVDTNITGTLNLLQAARTNGIENFIHTSTSEVYGTAQFVPIDERHPLVGQSPYSATKIAADQIAFSYYSSFELPVTTVRPFNTYGPRQSIRAVIPTIITQLAKGNKIIKLGALTPTRDFNFVGDTVRGFITAENSKKGIGEVVNIGSNFEISIEDTVKTIGRVMNIDFTIECDEERMRPEKSEVNRLYSCNKKAKELLDWKPEFGGIQGFEKGIEKTIEWFTKPSNLSFYKYDGFGL